MTAHYDTVRPHGRLGYRPPPPENSDAAVAGFRFRFASPPTAIAGGGDNALTNNPHPRRRLLNKLAANFLSAVALATAIAFWLRMSLNPSTTLAG